MGCATLLRLASAALSLGCCVLIRIILLDDSYHHFSCGLNVCGSDAEPHAEIRWLWRLLSPSVSSEVPTTGCQGGSPVCDVNTNYSLIS